MAAWATWGTHTNAHGSKLFTHHWMASPKRFDLSLRFDPARLFLSEDCEANKAARRPTTGKMLILWHSHHAIGAGQTSSLNLLHGAGPRREVFRSEGVTWLRSPRMPGLSRYQPVSACSSTMFQIAGDIWMIVPAIYTNHSM